jgi:hypothetical protein
MKEIFEITEIAWPSFTEKAQDIVNAIHVMSSTKERLEQLRSMMATKCSLSWLLNFL